MKNLLFFGLGVTIGVYLDRNTSLFDHLVLSFEDEPKGSYQNQIFGQIDAQVKKGEGITNEAATGNND